MAEFSISEGSFDPDAAYEDSNTFSGLTAGLTPPEPSKPEGPPPVGFDEVNNKVFVNGFEFDADDHDSAIRSRKALDNPLVPMPVNYRPMGAPEFNGYIKRIQDPSIGRIMKKNFGIGVDNLQLLGGRGLQFLNATETGQKIVDQQVEDLAYTQPYQRLFTDIDSAGGAVEWFLANLAQQGPMLIESSLAAIAGGIAGGVAGGGLNPFTALGGAFLALSGKAAVKRAAIEAAKKQAAGETLDAAEQKLLREVASGAVAAELKLNAKSISPTILPKGGGVRDFLGKEGLKRGGAEALKRGKLQGRIGGAIAGRYASSLGIGVSDVYGEQLESGTGDRGTAAALAIPYALAETLPELLGLGFFIKGGKNVATGATTAGRGTRALKRAGRAAVAGTVAAAGEGTTEAFQESLLLSQNPEVDAASEEGINRLINSFAAGAGVGGAIGTVGGAVRGERALESDNADILKPSRPEGPRLLEGPEQMLLEGPRLMLEGPEQTPLPVPQTPLLEGPEDTGGPPIFNSDLPDALFEASQAAQVIGVPPVDNTQRDPGQIPIIPPAPAPVAPTAQPEPVDFPPGAGLQETQDFLAAQEATPNPALEAAYLSAENQRQAQIEEQQAQQAAQAEAQAIQAAQEEEARFAPAEAQNIALPPGQQELFPDTDLGVVDPPLGFPATLAEAPAARFVKGEEAIASPTDGVLTPVRELIKKAQQRFDALQQLQKCLS